MVVPRSNADRCRRRGERVSGEMSSAAGVWAADLYFVNRYAAVVELVIKRNVKVDVLRTF